MELTENQPWGVSENPDAVPENRQPTAPLKTPTLYEREGRRFGRRMARAEYTRRRLHRVTPEALAAGTIEARLMQRVQRLTPGRPARYIDLVDYLVGRGWTRKRSEARAWLREGKVNVNGKVWAYPHFLMMDLEHDNRGLPRVMVEGQPDPRRMT